MTETLYPVGYGTRFLTFDELQSFFAPHMHPEAARRGFNFVRSYGGKFGIGSGYRPPGVQPNRVGFAAPGTSFHEGQQFPSGRFYVAWDMVVKNPGGRHRPPLWSEVPRQGTQFASDFGLHMNVTMEPWHMQPVELDGQEAWVNAGRPDIQYGRPIIGVISKPPARSTPPIIAALFQKWGGNFVDVRRDDTGEHWRIWANFDGTLTAAPFSQIRRGADEERFHRIRDRVIGPLVDVPGQDLQDMYNVQGKGTGM